MKMESFNKANYKTRSGNNVVSYSVLVVASLAGLVAFSLMISNLQGSFFQ